MCNGVPWANCAGPSAGRQCKGNREAIWLHHALTRAVESTSRHLGWRVLEIFPWWSPSGKLSYAPPWQDTLPPPNRSMGTAGKEWPIKAWAPRLPHVPPFRQFPGHSGQGQATLPPVLGTGHQASSLAAFSPPRWLTVYYLYHWQSRLVNVALQGFGEDS